MGSALAASAQGPGPADPAGATAAEVLSDPDAGVEARFDAAGELLASGRRPAIERLIETIADENDPSGTTAVARAVAASPSPPPVELVQPLGARLAGADEPLALAILDALSRYHTREAIGAVMDNVVTGNAGAHSTRVARKAFETLRVQTGRIGLPDVAGEWQEWWEGVRFLPPADWRSHLLEAQLARARAQQEEIAALTARVTDLYQRLHLRTPVEQRSDVIEELLSDSRSELRLTGIELANRALLNAQPLSDEAIAQAAKLLRSPRADVRASAARLLERIGRDAFTTRLFDALSVESDPIAAGAMLRAIGQQAEPSQADVIERWLLEPGPARTPAIRAYEHLLAEGFTPDQETRHELIAQCAPGPGEALLEEEARLLARLGFLAPVITQLESPDEEDARVAADALALVPEGVEVLLGAASREPGVFLAAGARAVASFAPSSAHLERLLEAQGAASIAQDGPRSEVRAALAAAPPVELLRLVESLGGRTDAMGAPAVRDAILTSVLTGEYVAAADQRESRIVLLIRLVRLRLDRGDAQGVLGVMQSWPEQIIAEHLLPERVEALLALGDHERAIGLTDPDRMPASAWIDHIEGLEDAKLAADLARRIRDLYEGRLSAQQAEALDAMIPEPDAQAEDAPAAESEPTTGDSAQRD